MKMFNIFATICITLCMVKARLVTSSDEHQQKNNLEWPYSISRNLQHLAATCPGFSPQDCICETRPYNFLFKYTGNTCGQSANSQADKFTCTGKSAIANSGRKGAYLVFSEKNDGDVLFQGWVKTGDKFEFNNGGGKFPADMDVKIYSGNDKNWLLQSVRFHKNQFK